MDYGSLEALFRSSGWLLRAKGHPVPEDLGAHRLHDGPSLVERNSLRLQPQRLLVLRAVLEHVRALLPREFLHPTMY
jgi:hypothetical protein